MKRRKLLSQSSLSQISLSHSSQRLQLPQLSQFLFSVLPLAAFWVLLILPLFIVFLMAFAKRGVYGDILWEFSLEHVSEQISRLLDFQTLEIVGRSFRWAALNSFFCAMLGVPAAWVLATLAPRPKMVWLTLIAIPLLTNLIVRLYAAKLFVGVSGPLQSLLRFFNLPHDPFAFTQNQWLVGYGLVSTYLPFFILPLYSALERMDWALIEAAQDLGANSRVIFFRLLLPVLARPILFSTTLVFIPTFGEYLIPDLLGGAKTRLVGNLITDQFLKVRDWPMGSLLSVMMILTFLIIFGMNFERANGKTKT